MKIAVIGYSGSGKSTLARGIAEHYGIKALHLDAVNFTENWRERDRAEADALVRSFMTDNESWVIDGNYSGFLRGERFEQANRIIFLDFNRFSCFFRVCKRYRTFKNTSRPDMADGCDEKLDFEFIRWVLHDGRTKAKKQGYRDTVTKYGGKVTVLKNQKQLDGFCREYFGG